MDYYHIWCNLKESHRDLEFSTGVASYMAYLRERGLIEGYRLTRRKLGFGDRELGEFHIIIEVRDMAQLEAAFQRAASRDTDVEPLHRAVYGAVRDSRFALYRDFPDPARVASAADG